MGSKRAKVQPVVKRTPHSCGANEWRHYDSKGWVCVPCGRLKWRREHPPEKERDRRLKRTYGITPEQFNAMLFVQQGRCDICGDELAGTKEPMVDHCHETQAVRSLLCGNCNTLLGGARDRADILVAALDYLTRHHPTRYES